MGGMGGTGERAAGERAAGGPGTSFEEIRSRLDGIAEDLADLARAKLMDAVETGSADAAAAERRLLRARRAVLKAGALLRGAEAPEDAG
jgi:hypothetical protein